MFAVSAAKTISVLLAAQLATGCATLPLTEPVAAPEPEPAPERGTDLARFMRERVNVPFSFALVEQVEGQRPRRVHRAAVVLQEAAQHLVHWSHPPTETPEAREVFFAYAQNLEYLGEQLAAAADRQDVSASAHTLRSIRHTCNSCHRYFRPASLLSQDVAVAHLALGLEAIQ